MIFLFLYYFPIISLFEGSFRNQTCDNTDRWKAEMGRVREEKRREEERESLRRKKDPGESRLAKAAGAEPSGMRDEKVHAAVARSTFPSQNVQNTSAPEYF